MSKPPAARRIAVRTAAIVSGGALLAYLVWRVGPGNLLKNIATLGWGLALIIALGGVAHLVKTCAWRLTLTSRKGGVSFSRMLQVRLASEAVGQVGILAQIFGEGLRVSALGTEIPMDNRISSVALDRAMFIVSGAMVSMVGIVAALLAISLTHAFRVYAVLFVIILFGLLLVVVLAMLNRWPFMSRSARVIGRLQFLRQRVENALPLIDSVENKLFDFHRWTPGAFWASLGLNLACQAMAVLEVYLVLWLMGIKIGLLGALVFESLTKLVNAVGSFNPGNIGTYEGGNMLIAKLFGVTGAVGLSIAVTRRLRAIFWAAVGVFCLFPLPRFKSNSKSDRSMSTSVAKSNKTGLGSQGATQAFTSVIFASAFRWR